MLASITPLGERSRRQHWATTVGFHLAGGVAGGAAGGLLLGALGLALPLGESARLLVLAAVIAVGTVLDVGVLGLRLPSHRHQVNEDWLRRYRGWVYGAAFGAQLGVGWTTVVTTSALYATLVSALLAPSLHWAIGIGAFLGGIRGAAPLATWRLRTPARLGSFHRRFVTLDRVSRAAALAAQVSLALLAAGAAL